MTIPISNSSDLRDPMLALAALLLDDDHARERNDAAALARAREEQRRAMHDAVDALHEAADSVATGALLQGGLTLAGGIASGAGAVGAACRTERGSTPLLAGLSSGGEAARGLSAPVFALFGDAPRLEAEADARAAEHRRTQASWQADDASGSRQRSLARIDHTLGAVENMLDAQHQLNIAVLSNF